jgi:hypothetical protein
LSNTFQLHGYLENQTIERANDYVKDWHNASLRNRLDIELSGTIARSLDLPMASGASVEYFIDMRPGYEASYDVDRDRFGNATTGYSGGAPGQSPFRAVPGLSLSAVPNAASNLFGFFPNYIQAFGNPASSYFVGSRYAYNPKQFMMQGPPDYTVPMPIDPATPYLPRIGGAFQGPNVHVPLSKLRWEIDDSTDADQDYPVREAYFDIRWFWHGQNWLRLGKQQVVWGKADFFRLQDTVNNVDFAQHYNVEPFEDTRIPNWSAALQHRFGDIGPARDVALTGIWNFDQYTPVGLGQGGSQAWATSYGQELRSFSFTGDAFEHSFNGSNNNKDAVLGIGQMAKFGPHGYEMPAYNFKNMGYGAKLDWENETPQIRFALTDFIGEGDPVFRMFAPNIMATGLNPLYSNLGGPTLSTALPQTYACLLNRGYRPVVWGLGTVFALRNPVQALTACVPKGYGNVNFMRIFGADGESNVVFHKANTLGLSADYFEPESGLVIRAESSWTHNALITDSSSYDWTANNDILQWVIGADSQFFIRPLNPDRTFFGSMQVFAHYDPGASSFGRTGDVQRLSSYVFTAFVQTHYDRDQIIPLIFAAETTQDTSAEIGGNVEWLLNDHWSATAGFTSFVGKANRFDLTYDTAVKPGCFLNTACNPIGAPGGGSVQGFNNRAYTEQFLGATQQPLGAYRNDYDEIWTRLRYRF